ncbi:MAG: hypothetical protein KIT56_02650 [Gammaproteobacteria bacterium]|nr:hypothetical protein [Gammaproteobacteria bacterium]MCW5582778.1 hypothetical protein [Gammaproteobacteria bacterium]
MSYQVNRKLLAAFLLFTLGYSLEAIAEPTITFIHSKYSDSTVPTAKIARLVKENFDVNQFRQIKTQVIYNEQHQIDHVLVYLFSKKYHGFELVRMNLGKNFQVISVQEKYQLSKSDYAQQPGINIKEAKCPDPSIEFIAFAPNDDSLEQKITQDVANAAESHSLKTVRLFLNDATSKNYLNYMTCPKLKGNFYNGDADPEVITTVDGVIRYRDIEAVLYHQFRYKVTNIWLACMAYNDPIKTSVIDVAQSQKYAAGINDLLVGPSDRAAACAMKKAMDGKPMTASFNECYLKYDVSDDKWGFGGNGADIFGT